MIQLNVETVSKSQANEVIQFLLEENLIVNPSIVEIEKLRLGDEGKLLSVNHQLVQAKTKALLFETIDKLMRERFATNMPILYAVPIVQMDWEQGNELRDKTIKV